MRYKVAGSVLMILGTALGAGMLALPVVSSQQAFLITALMLVTTWFLMTAGAFALLEVNLWFPSGSNLVSMAKGTLGKSGKVLVWVVYLALLYCLICSYLSGAGDVLSGLLASVNLIIPLWVCDCLALLILGSIVVIGMSSVDRANRVLMFFKILAYLFVVIMIMPNVQLSHLVRHSDSWHWSVLTVMATSFGFAIIVPSLRSYLGAEQAQLNKILLIGSCIPLIIYLLWSFVVQGVLRHSALQTILHSNVANTLLINNLQQVMGNAWVAKALSFFVSICVMTSFLGVSVCLIDFIADGAKLSKSGGQGFIVYACAYLPPLVLVVLGSSIFYKALQYAGLCCVLLLMLLPLLMLYVGRYHQQRQQAPILIGGRLLVLFFIMISLVMAAYFLWVVV
jgi:tyrosine-specific transport protein